MKRRHVVAAICIVLVLSLASSGTAVIRNDDELRAAITRCESTVRQRAGSYSQFRTFVSTLSGLKVETTGNVREHVLFWECMLSEHLR
jgi:hypothetical protein